MEVIKGMPVQEVCQGTAGGNNTVVVSSGTCGAGCGERQVNLHVFAFDKLAPIRLGNIQIQLRQVRGNPSCWKP